MGMQKTRRWAWSGEDETHEQQFSWSHSKNMIFKILGAPYLSVRASEHYRSNYISKSCREKGYFASCANNQNWVMKSLKGIFHHCQVKLVAQSAPRTLLQLSGTAWAALPRLYFAVKKHWTWCFLSWLLTWKFRNGFNLGYFSGWYKYMISTVP